jgi:hypothetical protein
LTGWAFFLIIFAKVSHLGLPRWPTTEMKHLSFFVSLSGTRGNGVRSMSITNQKFDAISVAGKMYKEIARDVCHTKLSAFYINDLIARHLGFKGHSDYLASAIMDPISQIDKITKKSNIKKISNEIFEKIDKDAYAIGKNNKTNEQANMRASLIEAQKADISTGNEILDAKVNEIINQVLSAVQEPPHVTAASANLRELFYNTCRSQIEDIRMYYPILFSVSQFIDAYQDIFIKHADKRQKNLEDWAYPLLEDKDKEFKSIKEFLLWLAPDEVTSLRDMIDTDDADDETQAIACTLKIILKTSICLELDEVFNALIKSKKVINMPALA